jgi:hypothetical protein
MKSRRRIAFLKASDHANCIDDYSRDLRLAKWVSEVSLHGSNFEPLMSALGQKRTFCEVCAMSALPQKRTSRSAIGMSALCQKRTFCAAVGASLFDHLVGGNEQVLRDGEAECFSGPEI